MHSRISPSSASRWVNCSGSVAMSSLYPGPRDSEAAREGEASHWAGAQMLTNPPVGAALTAGMFAPNGVVLDMEMLDSAWQYASAVTAAAQGARLVVEQPMRIETIHPECFGTPDCWYYSAPEIHVWDYKYGFKVVEPYENWQGICYAIGILDMVSAQYRKPIGELDRHITVVIHIVQPRAHHFAGSVREWRVPAVDLRAHTNRLHHAATVALSMTPEVCSGAWCQYCSARHSCAAAQKAALAACDYQAQAVPDELTPEGLSLEMRMLERCKQAIEHRLTGLQARTTALINSGVRVPGYVVQQGYGRETWSRPASEIFSLGAMFGADLRKQPEPITPNQARGLKKIPAETLKAFTTRPVKGVELVREEQTMAARLFGSVPIPKGDVA